MMSLIRKVLKVGLWSCLFLSAQAQETTALPPDMATLPRLNIAGSRGETLCQQLFIRLAKPVNELHIFAHDLPRQDGQFAFPDAGIQLQAPLPVFYQAVNSTEPKISRCPEKTSSTAPLVTWRDAQQTASDFILYLGFDLTQAPANGEFNGQIRLRFENSELLVPVTIRVKETWEVPLLLLVMGVSLGLWVSFYRQQGQPRDRILAPAGQLRQQSEADQDLPAVFKDRLHDLLIDVDSELNSQNLPAAHQALQQAATIWRNWRKEREEWLEQLQFCEQLDQQVGQYAQQLTYANQLKQSLANLSRQAPDLPSVQYFSEVLSGFVQQWAHYASLQKQNQTLSELSGAVEEESQQTKFADWKAKCQKLRPALPKDKEDFTVQARAAVEEMTQLENEAQQLIEQFQKAAQSSKGVLPTRDLGESPALELSIVGIAKLHTAADWQTAATAAEWRLRIFSVFSYAVTIVFLAGYGFNELYVKELTFGLQPVQDYLGLLAWGFGAEAARQSVTDLIREWRLSSASPVFKQS